MAYEPGDLVERMREERNNSIRELHDGGRSIRPMSPGHEKRAPLIALVATLATLTVSGCVPALLPGEKRTPATTSTASVREVFNDGGLTVQIMAVWEQKLIVHSDNSFSTHEPRGIWFLATMNVVNKSNKEQSFDGMFQNLIVDGKKFSPDTFAANDAIPGMHTSVSLNPGFSDDVVAAFDIPVNTFPATQKAELDVQADMMAPDVFVRIDGTPKIESGFNS